MTMKKSILLLFSVFLILSASAGNIEKTYHFTGNKISTEGSYQKFILDHTLLTGMPGEPVLPYQEVALMLPPGEVAESIEVIGENEISVPGSFVLYPKQNVQPISKGPAGGFIRNEKVYSYNGIYPSNPAGHLLTQYMNGYGFALSTFTPVKYNPATGKISYYSDVTIRIRTHSDARGTIAMRNLTSSKNAIARVKEFAQNPEMMDLYPRLKNSESNYQLLIITTAAFQAGFQDLIDMYAAKGIIAQVKTIESIVAAYPGIDNQEKIRNCIIGEYQNFAVEYVILGGTVAIVPYRAFYCHVDSSSPYDDWNIPSDLYFSGLDGNYDANGNQTYAEVDDDPDLVPDVAVTRFPFSTAAELQNMIHKTVSYQTNPVLGELKRPFMVGEHLYDDPMTEGGDYLDLLIDDHTDNGYFTHGIQSATNEIEKLYDTLVSPPANMWNWSVETLLAKINQGKQFIHHSGHANVNYMMRLYTWDITNANFYNVNGIDHNYTLMYTHGCLDGAFDENDCIAVKCVTIQNFLVGGVFNSRYGWFDQGTTEGPSAHLHREFVSALYNDTTPEKHFGTAHMISKIKNAPWITAPGQFEPGATRWCHYCCNAFGDAAMAIWTDEPTVGISEKSKDFAFSVYPNPVKDKLSVTFSLGKTSDITISVYNTMGLVVAGPTTYTSQAQGKHTLEVSLPNIASGIYYCRIATGSSTGVQKVMVVN
jgi:hypothetical protein